MQRKIAAAVRRATTAKGSHGWYCCLPFLVLGCFVVPAGAAAPSCRPADDNSAYMIAVRKATVSSTDPQRALVRRDMQLPTVDSSTIVLVTQTQVCNKALTAFLTTLPADFPTPLPTNVYVAKVGNVYVAMYPTPGQHGSPYAVLDSKYKVLSTFSF